MALSYDELDKLASYRKAGLITGNRVATLGVLNLHINELMFVEICARHGFLEMIDNQQVVLDDRGSKIWAELREQKRFYAKDNKGTISSELFFKILGFDEVIAIDISDYQGASVLLDLNLELSSKDIGGEVDLVVDAGTSEHLFNVPQAFKNYHAFLKEGGCIYHYLPANNYMEHGFYQFSPTFFESYYRANNYKLHAIDILFLDPSTKKISPRFSVEYNYSRINPVQWTLLRDKLLVNQVLACKTSTSTCDKIPFQGAYEDQHWGDSDMA
ncbi:MAG: hypothetical protein HON65_12615 [Rhodospirillales bacterium]|jgi:hypothetical protein|nr:hypothetical protein [Rhodospirillales bacterium]